MIIILIYGLKYQVFKNSFIENICSVYEVNDLNAYIPSNLINSSFHFSYFSLFVFLTLVNIDCNNSTVLQFTYTLS